MGDSRIVLLRPYKLGNYQFFRQWAAEAWKKIGGEIVGDYSIPWKIKMLVGKSGVVRHIPGLRTNTKMLVLCCGRPDYFSWPWCYTYEIVPVLWDCWPKYWSHLLTFLRRNNTRTIFCTSSQTAEFVRSQCPEVNAVWLPEGIDVASYLMGNMLTQRNVDILELGRQMPNVHEAILECSSRNPIRHLYQRGGSLLFPDFESLTNGLRNAKITISYPRCDTHPEMAGSIETMTQRYWECMLSGSVIAGRAPAELVDFCGYNPVVPLGEHPASQLMDMLSNISDFQPLVLKNRKFAELRADWTLRMKRIMSMLTHGEGA